MKKIIIFWITIWVLLGAFNFIAVNFLQGSSTYWDNQFENEADGLWLDLDNTNIKRVETAQRYFGVVDSYSRENKKLSLLVGSKVTERENSIDTMLVDVKKENATKLSFDLSKKINLNRIYVVDNYIERNEIEKINLERLFDYLDASRFVSIEIYKDISGDGYQINEIILSLN